MLISGTTIMCISIVFVMVIKNIKLKNLDSMQGVVF